MSVTTLNLEIKKPSSRALAFRGTVGGAYSVYVKNALLTVLTLGLYWPWARVEILKYFYGHTELDGDRFAFHGNGRELLPGWLKVGAILIPLYLVTRFSDSPLWGFLFFGVVLLLVPFAIVGSRRYRMSRTSWRGIRFSFRGRASDFAKLFLRGVLFAVLSLGLYYPYFHSNVRKFLIDHTYFGTRRFEYYGDGSALRDRYLLTLLLFLPTFGLYWFWFAAARERYYWSHTLFGDARFSSDVTGRELWNLKAANGFLLGLTYGLAWPWTKVRKIRFIFENRALDGPLDLEAIQQEAQAASATGEGLADMLDIGPLDFDLGI